MATNARIFFAGIGTTFIIIAAGFGGGLMFAKTMMNDAPSQSRAASHQLDPVRVILPTTAEAAPAPQPVAAVEPAPAPEIKSPEQQVEKVSPVQQVEKIDTRKADAEERVHRKRVAERKARKIRQQMEAKQRIQQLRPSEPRILAFDADEPRSVSFFGN